MDLETCNNLWMATGEGRLCDVHRLVEAGADVDENFLEGMTSLHFATLQGHVEIVHYLVDVGGDVNKASDIGLTPLMSACAQGFIHLARLLVQSGARVNAVNNNLESPLMYLCKARAKPVGPNTGTGSLHGFYKICHSEDICGCLDLVKLLVASGADVNLVDCDGTAPLVGFILSGHFAVAKFLIHSGAKTNLATTDGVTALLLACRLKHSLELIEMLLSAGADVNHARAPEGTTPLMAACYSGTDNVEALLNAGALVNATNSKRETALKCAVFATNPSVIENLTKAGVWIGKELVLAVVIGHGESIQTLIINGALPTTSGSMLSLKNDIEYLSRRFSVWASNFLTHKLLAHLDALGVTSLTPFMVSLMRKDTAVARYFVKNLFFHPLDIRLLQDLQKKCSNLEDCGLSSSFCPLVTQPWSLFNLSFLCVSFAVGFYPDREKRILLTGLPFSLHRKFLYRDKTAFFPVQDWANLDLIL